MSRAYGLTPHRRWHPLVDADVAVVGAVAVLGVWAQSARWVVAAATLATIARKRLLVTVLCVLLGSIGAWRSGSTWSAAHPRQLGSFAGWVTVVGDPTPFGSGLRVTLNVDGERFDSWVYGSARRRLIDRQAGDRVYVEGERRPTTSHVRRAQLRHVVGRLDLLAVGDWREGSPLFRATSRVRGALRRAAQRAIFYVQRELEIAGDSHTPAIVLCDRGTIDGLAYWPGPSEEFWSSLGTTLETELGRYHAVIHLRTPGQDHGYNHQNPVRTESAGAAADIDARILQAWARHRRRFVVE